MLTEKIDPTNKNIVFVHTTCRDADEARSIAIECIEKRLAVCSDYWPINSIYPWEGVLQETEQYMLVLTTQKGLARDLMKHIEGIHSYSVPVIAECDITIATQNYRFWIEETLENKTSYLSSDEAQKKKSRDEENGYHPGELK